MARRPVLKITYILICLACSVGTSVRGEEHIVFEQDGKRREVRGEVLVTAEDGGVLLTDRAGVYWAIQKDEVVERNSDDVEFTPLSFQQVEESLLAELPAGFSIHRTKHYIIAYATTPAYARWCGSLYERLYRAFTNVWSTKRLKLKEPRFPLVAIIFPDRASYTAHAQGELGDAAESIIGFYSLQTNHMTMYDLSGMSKMKTGSGRIARSVEINRFLRQPGAAATVATIVHEATHQIAYNCGLHTRFADEIGRAHV